MLKREISDTTVKERLRAISLRVNEMTISNITESVKQYGSISLDNSTSTELIDKIYFSNYPGVTYSGASALSAVLLNESNVKEIRNTGGLGAVLEMLRRININKEEASTEHVKNLIDSLYIIVIGDKIMQQKCLTNPYSLDTLLNICKCAPSKIQSKAFEILDSLSKCEGGLKSMIEKNVLITLVSPDLLTTNNCRIEIRHSVANMIHRSCIICPNSFPILEFEKIALKSDGITSNLDAYMEMQLLQATLCHFNWLNSQNKVLGKPFLLLKYFLNCVINETFESLDHMQLIMKLVVAVLKDIIQMDYMLNNNLDIVLQYIVRTDFELFRRKNKKKINNNTLKTNSSSSSSLNNNNNNNNNLNNTNNNLNINNNLINNNLTNNNNNITSDISINKNKNKKVTNNRSIGTLLALTLIERPPKGTNRSEDINLTVARVALNIYEGIMEHKISIIGEIVSSGLIPALLFRVGKGVSVDKHFCKLLTRFLNNLLRKVLHESQNIERQRIEKRKSEIISSTNSITEEEICIDEILEVIKKEDVEETMSQLSHASLITSKNVKTGSTVSKFKSVISGTEIRTISHTLHAQGVTEMFGNSIINSEDNEVVADALQALAMLTFDAVYSGIGDNLILIGRICLLCNNRMDCFLPGISLTCAIILYKELDDELINLFVIEFKIIPSLVRALKPASLLFRLNMQLYTSIAKLSVHPQFYSTLKKTHGITLLCREIEIRKKKLKANRRNRAYTSLEDDGTMQLLKVLRRDWAATKIQDNFRIYLQIKGFLRRKKNI